jgi:preprotein translocase subunit SecY
MGLYHNLLQYLPEVANPLKKMSLKNKLLWTFGILVLYLFLATIPLYGILAEQETYFKTLELLLGAKFGKLLTLGIGPIVMSSIVLQLLKGSGILNFDLNSHKGKFTYTGTHKLLTFAFIILQAIVFVKFGAVSPASPEFAMVLSLQLALGGFIVFYMDEVVKKWGFGSGVSLFIAAGIGQMVFLQLISPFTMNGDLGWGFGGTEIVVGKIWALIYFLAHPEGINWFTQALGPILITIGLFFLIVFFQSINVYIPLSFGRIRGKTIKWPLNFFYSGVIPVILISALGSNIQLWARGLQNFAEKADASTFTIFISKNILGQFSGNVPISGIVSLIAHPQNIWTTYANLPILQILSYTIFMVGGCSLLAYLWIQTSGQDPRSVANQILNSGLQIPGFRRDVRIIEKILKRYILPLTIMGGIGIGVLAVLADILGALASGTGILLMIMIIYQFYQQLGRESMEDFSMLQRFMRK